MARTRIRGGQEQDQDFLSETESNDFYAKVVITGTVGDNDVQDTTVLETFDDYLPGRGLFTGVDGITVITGTQLVTISGFQSEVNETLDALLPPDAPSLDNIEISNPTGVAGKNTRITAQPITTYQELPGDGLDVTFSTGGTENGVVASGASAWTGVLNDDVAAHAYAYPADSFGEADVGTLQLLVNSNIIHSENLVSFGSGATTNGNGSGFTLSAATPVQFSEGASLETRKYRTGTWNVEVEDQSNGYNAVQVRHVVTSGTISTNDQEWVVDDDTTATSFSSDVLDNLLMAGSKYISGVEYHTSGTADYDITISNAQRNTYRTGTPISFTETNVANVSDKAFSATGGNEGQTTVITNENVTINSTSLLNGSISMRTTVLRTVQSSANSTTRTISGILLNNVSATSTDLADSFNDEDYRIQSDEDFSTDLAATWDSTVSLVGGDGGHNDGMQVYNGALDYPTIDFSAITNGPAGNVNYSAAAGTRYYYRYFTETSPTTANFRLSVAGTATLISEASALGTGNNNVKISIRAPSQTGWLDTMVAFTEGFFGDGDGAYSSSLGSDQTIPTTNLGLTIGTKSTANSFDKIYVRITVGAGWTGTITSMSLVWGAS